MRVTMPINVGQEALGALDSFGPTQKGGRPDRARPEGCGREDRGGASETEAPQDGSRLDQRVLRAVHFVKAKFTDEFGDAASDYDAFVTVVAVAQELLGLRLTGPLARQLRLGQQIGKGRAQELIESAPNFNDFINELLKVGLAN